MCGIAGIYNLNGKRVDEMQIKRMTDAIRHRGPDGEGYFTDGNLGLGHRRLAVLDLTEAGRQPMTEESGRFHITYNGEVYNFQEIRKELESAGCRFRSRTDSEVVLQAYRTWGPDCLTRFNGMFAFAIWDRKKKELFLARDRYGIKPLYYMFSGSIFLFASEQKAILTHPSVKRVVDPEALLEYFTFQNIFTDKTILRGMCLFPAGCWALLTASKDCNGEALKLDFQRYWDFHFEEPSAMRQEEEYLEELDRLFRQAVKRQLASDVEIGCYLSGGMDSGSITAAAASELPRLKTFTCGFDLHSASGIELGFDEREKAEMMSHRFKTEQYEIVLKAGDMERIMPTLAWHMEEPRVGQSYPNFYIAQLAGKFVKVVLSGAGGDELFGGYPWRYYRAVSNDHFEDYIDKYYHFWQRLIPNTAVQDVFKPVWPRVKQVWTRDIFRDVFKGHEVKLDRPEDYVNHSLYFEAKTFLHGLLNVEDKLSMAHGLEVRVPFLDNDLVDFAMKLPVRYKLAHLKKAVRFNENEPGGKANKYFEKTRDGKLILRKLMGRYIPKEIAKAAKQGFSSPDASWFKGESMQYVRAQLFSKDARIYDWLDRTAVKKIVQEHLDGKQNRRLFIWSLLSFEWWLRTFMEAKPI